MSHTISKPTGDMDCHEWVTFFLDTTGVVLDSVDNISAIAAVPFVAIAVTSLKTIVQTIQTVRINKTAFQGLKDDTVRLVAVIVRSRASSKNPSTWPPEDLAHYIDDIIRVLEETKEFAKKQNSRNLFQRVGKVKADTHDIEKYRSKIQKALENLKLASDITTSVKVSEVLLSQVAIKEDASAAKENEKQIQALDKLAQRMARGASYDSSARQDASGCSEDTRNDEINKAIHWLEDADKHPRVLWVRSPAGFGKTTLAHTICEMAKESGYLGASFFWSRSDSRLPTTNGDFVSTIAYQLCHLKLNSTFTDEVIEEVLRNPAIFEKTLSIQMERLVINPLLADLASSKKSMSEPLQSMLIVADGIDECQGAENQKVVLDILLDAVRNEGLPLRILLCSRNDHVIKHTLESTSSTNMHVEIINLGPNYSGVKNFIISEFNSIKENLLDDKIHVENWPSPQDVDELVRRADGVFIYASVLMKYIASEKGYPVKRLKDLIESSSSYPGSSDAFTRLDQLYMHILKNIPSDIMQQAKEVLICCIYHDVAAILDLTSMTAFDFLDSLLGFEPGQTQSICIHLSSVIQYETSDFLWTEVHSIRFFHASFPDFLKSRERLGVLSDMFWYSPLRAHETVTRKFIAYYQSRGWSTLDSVPLVFERPIENIHIQVEGFLREVDNMVTFSEELLTDLKGLSLKSYFIGLDARGTIWWLRMAECVFFLRTLQLQDSLRDVYVKLSAELKPVLQQGLLKLPPALRDHIMSLVSLEVYIPFWLQSTFSKELDLLSLLGHGSHFSETRDSIICYYYTILDKEPTEAMYTQLAMWLVQALLEGPKADVPTRIAFDWIHVLYLLPAALRQVVTTNNPELVLLIQSQILEPNIFQSELFSNMNVSLHDRHSFVHVRQEEIKEGMQNCEQACISFVKHSSGREYNRIHSTSLPISAWVGDSKPADKKITSAYASGNLRTLWQNLGIQHRMMQIMWAVVPLMGYFAWYMMR